MFVFNEAHPTMLKLHHTITNDPKYNNCRICRILNFEKTNKTQQHHKRPDSKHKQHQHMQTTPSHANINKAFPTRVQHDTRSLNILNTRKLLFEK